VLLCTRTRPSPRLRQKDHGEGRPETDTLTVSSSTTPRNPNPHNPGTLSVNDARQPSHAHAERRGTRGRERAVLSLHVLAGARDGERGY
jgi:hypothetical protein